MMDNTQAPQETPQTDVIQGIELENFTAFRQLKLENFGRLNAIIGLNDTGKTQLLKVLYLASFGMNDLIEHPDLTNDQLADLIFVKEQVIFSNLYENGYKPNNKLTINFSNKTCICYRKFLDTSDDFIDTEVLINNLGTRADKNNSVFIPAKEMLGLHPAILETREGRKRLTTFDDTYYDLSRSLALRPDDSRPNLPETIQKLLDPLLKVTSKNLSVEHIR